MSLFGSEIRERLGKEVEDKMDTGQDWFVTHSSRADYQKAFDNVLHGRLIHDSILARTMRSQQAFAMDLMGYGTALDMPMTGGLAVSLSDKRLVTQQQRDSQKNIGHISGDVLKSTTWVEIEEWIKKNNTQDQGFHLIMCRPIRGIRHLTDRPEVHSVLLQRAWNVLSPDRGVLLTQTHTADSPYLPQWIDILNATPGIHADFHIPDHNQEEIYDTLPTLKLTRLPDAPEKLPQRI